MAPGRKSDPGPSPPVFPGEEEAAVWARDSDPGPRVLDLWEGPGVDPGPVTPPRSPMTSPSLSPVREGLEEIGQDFNEVRSAEKIDVNTQASGGEGEEAADIVKPSSNLLHRLVKRAALAMVESGEEVRARSPRASKEAETVADVARFFISLLMEASEPRIYLRARVKLRRKLADIDQDIITLTLTLIGGPPRS